MAVNARFEGRECFEDERCRLLWHASVGALSRLSCQLCRSHKASGRRAREQVPYPAVVGTEIESRPPEERTKAAVKPSQNTRSSTDIRDEGGRPSIEGPGCTYVGKCRSG